MSTLTVSSLILLSLVMMSYGRSVNPPDQFMPLFLASVGTNDNGAIPPSNGQSRFIYVIEQIVRYVSSIKSSDQFIESIVNRHKEPADKMRVLTFLNKCFELTRNVIQREIDFMSEMPDVQKKPLPMASPFTLEELQKAQKKVNSLLTSIDKQIESLKTWIPPTMPFLGFF